VKVTKVPRVPRVPKVPGVPKVLWCLGCLLCQVLLSAGTAWAQEAPELRAHRFVLEGGVAWSGGYPIGDVDAELRSNATGSTPPPFTLFSASSEMGSAASAAARIGFTLTPRVVLEGGASFGMPHVLTDISRDTETGPQELEGEELRQYVIDGALVWHLPLRFGARARPFVVGGAGYLRQLHEEQTMVETGQIYYGGIGARYWFRGGSGTARSFGLRADLRANVRRGGIDFENKVRVFPSVVAGLFISL
jgi:hypothetical protein